MPDSFREMFEGLKQTADALIQANSGIKRAVGAPLEAQGEHQDVRETVHRLESLVLQQGEELRQTRHDVRQLRERLNGHEPPV